MHWVFGNTYSEAERSSTYPTWRAPSTSAYQEKETGEAEDQDKQTAS